MPGDQRKILFDHAAIQLAVERVAGAIVPWLKAGDVPALDIVSVLEGARPFTGDLVQNLKGYLPGMDLRVHEIRVRGTRGKKLLESRELSRDALKNERLGSFPALIVDDLVDSGKTLEVLKSEILVFKPPQVKTAVLLRKFGPTSCPVDFCGFDLNLDREEMARRGLKDYWLYGYGMDEDGRFRELDHIGWVEIR